jgi:hypothetical protein
MSQRGCRFPERHRASARSQCRGQGRVGNEIELSSDSAVERITLPRHDRFQCSTNHHRRGWLCQVRLVFPSRLRSLAQQRRSFLRLGLCAVDEIGTQHSHQKFQGGYNSCILIVFRYQTLASSERKHCQGFRKQAKESRFIAGFQDMAICRQAG